MSNKESNVSTFGAELEMAVATIRGEVGQVDNRYFTAVAQTLREYDKLPVEFHESDVDSSVIIGIKTQLGIDTGSPGEIGLDNGFNLLETATPVTRSLDELFLALNRGANVSTRVLDKRGLGSVNMSIHPLGGRSMEEYNRLVVPKGIYPYLWDRGWDHSAGIDARAQNSPSTGVDIEYAARAVSVVIGAGAAFVGIFGNSPYEDGKPSGYKEARLTMWDRMLKGSKVPGDYITSLFPKQPFRDLAEYYSWMFGDGTGMHFVVGEGSEGGGYKGNGNKLMVVEENPPFLDYLMGGVRDLRYLSDIKAGRDLAYRVTPSVGQMEPLQFAQFAGARVRYSFNKSIGEIDPIEFVRTCKGETTKTVEELLSPHINSMWIEGRDPGTNLPDNDLRDLPGDIARSVMISPSAIQAGLLQNLGESEKVIAEYGWNTLKGLREAAIKDGLNGEYNGVRVRDFAVRIVEVAGRGISTDQHWMLSYPEYVLKVGKNGADRAIDYIERQGDNLEVALRKLVVRRLMIV